MRERDRLALHLEHCDACRQEYESLLYAVELTDSLGHGPLHAPPFSRIEGRISVPSSFWSFRWLFSPAWAAMAAGLLLLVSIPLVWNANDEEARLERQFAQFVEARDRQEALHHAIIQTEPVGWVTYNPFRFERTSLRRNPFSE